MKACLVFVLALTCAAITRAQDLFPYADPFDEATNAYGCVEALLLVKPYLGGLTCELANLFLKCQLRVFGDLPTLEEAEEIAAQVQDIFYSYNCTLDVQGILNMLSNQTRSTTAPPSTTAQTSEPQTTVAGPTTEPLTTVTGPTTEPITTVTEPTTEPITTVTEPTTEPITTVTEPTTEPITTVTEPTTEPLTTVTGPTTEPLTTVTGPTTEPVTTVTEPTTEPLTTVTGPTTEPLTTVTGPTTEPITTVTEPTTEPLTTVTGPTTEPLTTVTEPTTEPPTTTQPTTEPPTTTGPTTPQKPTAVTASTTEGPTTTAPPCIDIRGRPNGCEGLPDGDYMVCQGCQGGIFVSCSNGIQYVRRCAPNTGQGPPLRFDPVTGRCEYTTPFCP